VVAHVFYLADAKELLRAGIDGFAHGIRDLEVDEEIMALFKQHPQVFVIPNLPDTPPSIADLAWLSETLPPRADRRVEEKAVASPARPRLFDVQARSLKKLSAAGVRIAFGTDAGVGAPYGYFARTRSWLTWSPRACAGRRHHRRHAHVRRGHAPRSARHHRRRQERRLHRPRRQPARRTSQTRAKYLGSTYEGSRSIAHNSRFATGENRSVRTQVGRCYRRLPPGTDSHNGA
jgi:hypothetical protein